MKNLCSKKRLLALALSICLLLTCIPGTGMLAAGSSEPVVQTLGDFKVQVYSGAASFAYSVLTLQTGGRYKVAMEPGAAVTDDKIDIDGSAANGTTDLTISNLNVGVFSSNFSILIPTDYTADVNITISGNNRLVGSIQKNSTLSSTTEPGRLTITDGGDRTATLTVLGGDGDAGIGGIYEYGGKNIYINANVTATGGSSDRGGGAGIGGGYKGDGSVTINGGTVTATGGTGAAGIGGGYTGDGIVTINGGAVTATGGGATAAGIGGGAEGNGSVTINGGTVTAPSGVIGLGSGNFGTGSVTINGGVVSTTLIGSSTDSVTITGGSIFGSAADPVNAAGDALTNYTLSLYNDASTKAAGVQLGSLDGYSDYNLSNITTGTDGLLSVWLPSSVSLNKLRLADGTYYVSESGFGGSTTAASFYKTAQQPINVEILSADYSYVRALVYPYGSFPYRNNNGVAEDANLVELGTAGARYSIMLSTSDTAPPRPLSSTQEVAGIYLNDNYPTDHRHAMGSDFTKGSSISNDSQGQIGGDTYSFVMPETGAANITIVLANTQSGVAPPLMMTKLPDGVVGEGYSTIVEFLTYGDNILGVHQNITSPRPDGVSVNTPTPRIGYWLLGTPTRAGEFSIDVIMVVRKDAATYESNYFTYKNPFTVRDTLASPTNAKWNGAVATWDAVENADYYELVMYRDGVRQQTATSTTCELNFASYMEQYGAGLYSFAVHAVSELDYYSNSPSVTSNEYNFVERVAAPQFSVASGEYTETQSVTISSTTSGAAIYYTTDGSTPSATDGTLYSGAITISADCTLQAVAIATGMTDSAIASASYSFALSTPQLSAPSGLAWVSDSSFTATWGEVTGASGYELQIFKGGVQLESTVTTAADVLQYDFTTLFSSNGAENYLIAVRALGDGTTALTSEYSSSLAKTVDACSTPTFSPTGGTFTTTPSVTITAATNGATIYYTIDGGTPSATNGTKYTGAITISASCTLKAIAVKDGMLDSGVAAETYTITPKLATPSNLRWDGTTATWNAVDNAADYSVRLFKDGNSLSTLTTTTNSIDFAANMFNAGAGEYTFSVQALTTNSAYTNSEASAFSSPYNYTPTVATPVITPAAGTYYELSVTISCSTPSTTIYYTTDGSTPSATNGTLYTGSFAVLASCTVKAVAVYDSVYLSEVASTNYTIKQQLSKPSNLRWNSTTSTIAEWDAVPNAGTYTVYLIKNGNEESPLGYVSVTKTKNTFTSLMTDKTATYFFRVRANPGGGDFVASDWADSRVDTSNPQPEPDPEPDPEPEPEIVSVTITWAALEFSYNEGELGIWNADTHSYDNATEGSWSVDNDGGDLITVVNDGDVSVAARFSFTAGADMGAIEGSFSIDSSPASDPVAVAAGESRSVALKLDGAPASGKVSTATTIGEVTVKISPVY